MKATNILKNEHRMIEQVLNCLEKMAEDACVSRTFDRDSAREALEFFKNFADRCHHGKEEGALFPMLEARGMVRIGGPTGVMLHEHDQGRDCLKGMATAIDNNRPLQFTEHARNYLTLMREHIRKEDECLFPMAERLLGDCDADGLAWQFEHFEHEAMGAGVHGNYVDLANRLADRWGIARVPAATGCSCSCSGNKASVACRENSP